MFTLGHPIGVIYWNANNGEETTLLHIYLRIIFHSEWEHSVEADEEDPEGQTIHGWLSRKAFVSTTWKTTIFS